MDYPARKRKPGTAVPGPDEEADRLELCLAEYSAPRGEESPWREPVDDLPRLADGWAGLRPERGRLH